jgi:hypothetical protein
MIRRLIALSIALSCMIACSLAAAQPPDEEGGQKPVPHKTAYVSLAKQRGGGPALVIDYPWKAYTKASIELRLTKGVAATPDNRPPLLFFKTRMKGKDADVVYKCLDRSAEGDTTKPLTFEGTEYRVLGRRNALQKPAVCVVCQPKTEGEDSPTQTVAAVLILESWAVNGKMLYIDLPRDDFAEAGTLQVWFLRDDAVLWQETIAWPGYGKQPAAAKPPASKPDKPADNG